MEEKKLTADAVTRLAKYCLYKDIEAEADKIPDGAIVVDGLMRRFAFHPERLKASKPEIDALLLQLPVQFNRATGGGWTFLNAAMDKYGNPWGEQSDAEALICLGIGVGSAKWIMLDMADALPGGVPYLEVHPDVA